MKIFEKLITSVVLYCQSKIFLQKPVSKSVLKAFLILSEKYFDVRYVYYKFLEINWKFFDSVSKFKVLAEFVIRNQKSENINDIKYIKILTFGEMGIGNFIMYIPFLRSLKNIFPASEISMIFDSEQSENYLISQRFGLIDRYVFIPKNFNKENYLQNDFKYWKKFIVEDVGFPDIVFNRFNFNFLYLIIIIFCRPSLRIGFQSKSIELNNLSNLNTISADFDSTKSEIFLNLSLIGLLGVDKRSAVNFSYEPLQVYRSDFEIAEKIVNLKNSFICISPSVSKKQKWKEWPEDRWIQLVAGLHKLDYELVFLGCAYDHEFIEIIKKRSGVQFLNLAGKVSLTVAAAILQKAKLLVVNDSGLMHLAVSQKTPTVVIAGPTDKKRTLPFNMVNTKLVIGECKCNTGSILDVSVLEVILKCGGVCMSKVEATEVLDACITLLDNHH